MKIKPQNWFYLTAVAMPVLQACSNAAPVNVFPLPPAHYQILGRVEGMGCGTLALVGLVVNFIPFNDSDRLERAYRLAVGTLPGTTSLINVDVREDWFWWGLATTRCTLVTGDAIRRSGP